jgi:biopolymer transport protein ExbD
MKFYTRKRKSPQLIIVSLIDILAILLIFFIVTTTFRKNQPQLEINLPESKTAVPAATQQDVPILLRVKNADTITLDDKPVAIENLATTLKSLRESSPDRSLAMQADTEAPFGVVVHVLDALKEAGVKNIPAFTQPAPTPTPAP